MARNSRNTQDRVWVVTQYNVAPDGPIPVSFNRSREGAQAYVDSEIDDDGFVTASDFEIIGYEIDP